MSAKLWAVVKREYLERVRTKGFVIGTVLGPLLMGGMMIVPALAARSGGKPLKVAVLDATGALRGPVEEALRAARFDGKARFDVQPAPGSRRPKPAPARRRSRRPSSKGSSTATSTFPRTRRQPGRRATSDATSATASTCGPWSGRSAAWSSAAGSPGPGSTPRRSRTSRRSSTSRRSASSEKGEREDQGAAMIFSIILLMILYMSILMWGQAVMTVRDRGEDEPGRRGDGGGGLVDDRSWPASSSGSGPRGSRSSSSGRLSLFGVSVFAAGAAMGSFSMPEITPVMLVSFVLFFLLGFLFYAALYASIGAAVNTVQEAQSLAFPVLLPIILGAWCASPPSSRRRTASSRSRCR